MTVENNVRDIARRYIDAVMLGDAAGEDSVAAEAALLTPVDRALFQELTHGTIREWMFLDWVIAKYAPRPPRNALKTILCISAYQLLFLERIPDYAIFSQAAAISSALGLTEPELRFVHGLLKTVQKNKDKLLEMREAALARARAGQPPESAIEWAVLNAPPALVDALTVVEQKGQKRAARARAVRALASMRERAPLIGYVLPGQAPQCEFRPVQSDAAPLAVLLIGGPPLLADLKAGLLRVQGEASQWACMIAARWLDRRRSQPSVSVLEMAAGKGGKLLGTLAALTHIWGGNREAVPPLEWLACDVSAAQLAVFEQDTVPVVQRLWPQVKVRTQKIDWRHPEGKVERKFDLVLLDAPCTGLGTISKLPQIGLIRGVDAYNEALKMAEIQKGLCAEGLERVAPDGGLLYTVCTLTRPETLGVVEHITKTFSRQPSFVQALWPGSAPAPDAEGFFAAVI